MIFFNLGCGAKKLRNDDHLPFKKRTHPSSGGKQLPSRKRKNLFARTIRFVAATLISLVLVAVALGAIGYFLLQGNATKGSAVLARIETGLKDIVGEDFDVKLQNADLSFGADARVVFKSSDVQVTRKLDGKPFTVIGEIEARLNLIEVISGKTAVELVRIKNAELDADVLGSGRGVFLPTHLDKPFNVIGDTLSKFQNYLDQDQFEELEVINSSIKGAVLGRKQQDPVLVKYLSLNPDGKGKFILYSELETEYSNINLNSSYTLTENQGSAYKFLANGIHMREWFSDSAAQDGVIGSDALITLEGNIPFNENNKALHPTLNIKTAESTLRLGKNAITDVKALDLNLRLILEKNQIELDPSEVKVGRLTSKWVGGIKPYNAQRGYGGSLRYDLIMEKGEFEPTLTGEQVIPAGFQINGLYNVEDKDLLIDKIVLTTKQGAVLGKGRMLFGGETPSLKATATTNGISITAVKQFWPYFMAAGARDWVHNHLIDGWVNEGTLRADIPPGKIFRVRQGAKIKPEEFEMKLEMKDVAFRPFGEMPAIRESTGELAISGMKITSSVKSGIASTEGKKPIRIKTGFFNMEDYAAKERFGETKLSLEGEAVSIAAIADRKPLRVMERMKVTPNQFSGKGYADIVARFPIKKGTDYSQVDWHVLLDLQNASSSKALAGRKFTDANIVIDANPTSAKVVGSAKIDGVKAKLNLIEPIGKSGKAKRKREVVASMSEDARKAFGIDLKPVVKGPINVSIIQDKGVEKYNIDFKNAEIAMPWIGWSKGKGIPAKAEFILNQKDKIYRLNNFKLQGAGFFGTGNLVMSKNGLISADIKQLKLNDSDSMSLKVDRKDNTYNIIASGDSYDARSVMNTILYQGSFKKVEGGRSVNLTAKFKRVLGFEKRGIFNVDLLYQSRSGALTKLDMKGFGTDGRTYSVKAQRNGNQTLFTINSNDAGNAMAFTNIYTKMQGGKISAQLVRNDNGPFLGPVNLTNFTVVNEPRLAKMVSNARRQVEDERGSRTQVIKVDSDKRITFELAQADIKKGDGYLELDGAIIRNTAIGLSMDGTLYNKNDTMDIKGTFMPANAVNLALANIPILGRFFANGKDRALIGITYQLKGKRANPELLVNPLSIVTPGFFNRVFEFQ